MFLGSRQAVRYSLSDVHGGVSSFHASGLSLCRRDTNRIWRLTIGYLTGSKQ